MNWALAVVSTILVVILMKRSKPKGLWVPIVVLAAVGGVNFFETAVGNWVTGLTAGFFGWAAGLFGTSAGLIAGGLLLIAVVIVVLDVGFDHRADRGAVTALFMLPMLILISAGPISSGGSQFYDAVDRAGESSVGRLIGG